MKRSIYDKSLYIKDNLVITIYIDNILFFFLDLSLITKVKETFKTKYKIKDFREAKKFLRIKITRDRVKR